MDAEVASVRVADQQREKHRRADQIAQREERAKGGGGILKHTARYEQTNESGNK